MPMDISELKSKKIVELNAIAKDLGISGYSDLRKQETNLQNSGSADCQRRPYFFKRRTGSFARWLRLPQVIGL